MEESWVPGGNSSALGLGLNHLPYTAFRDPETGQQRLGVAIGLHVLDLAAASEMLPAATRAALRSPPLNEFLELGPAAWATLREGLQALLSQRNMDRAGLERALRPAGELELTLPFTIGDYTDFYAARDHARRVGELFRPEKPLLENYDSVPIGYHGRASSVVPSGTGVRRPRGQVRTAAGVEFTASAKLDFELELGFVVGTGNPLGTPIPIGGSGNHLFGVTLLNDWSARDIQAWEYQPLGPFLGKSFCTSISPLVTPIGALEKARTAAVPHPVEPLEYLSDQEDRMRGGFSIELKVELTTTRSRAAGIAPFVLSQSNAAVLFWTPAQMLAHHTSNGCNLRPGDLLGTGTISGPERESAGCLLELARGGAEPVQLGNGEQRRFLEDGDEIILSGFALPADELPIRLGECRGMVLPNVSEANVRQI